MHNGVDEVDVHETSRGPTPCVEPKGAEPSTWVPDVQLNDAVEEAPAIEAGTTRNAATMVTLRAPQASLASALGREIFRRRRVLGPVVTRRS
jgi:hypothetical protein